jgi:Fe-S cluster assembly protein SufB
MLRRLDKNENFRLCQVDDVHLDHEAFVGRISEEILLYLKSRGLTEEEAVSMIVRGYIQPILKHVPLEYALEIRNIADLVAKGES